jgi:RNA polymerase sigma-70 factor (ECF subfamily)
MDRHSFEQLHERTHRRLYRYLCRVSGDHGLAEDVLQDAYLKLLLAKNLPSEERQLEAYLFRTATHRMYDRWRRTRRETAWQDTLEVIARTGRDSGLRWDLERLMALLKPRERALVWLAHVEECSHREIAEILDVGERSVRVMLFRARKKLARLAKKLELSPGEDKS